MRIDTFYDTLINDPGSQRLFSISQTKNEPGVIAKTSLQPGLILVNIHGPSAGYQQRPALKNKESYCLQVGMDQYIKTSFPFFLFNHSCDPNCGINEYLQLITLKAVKAGEELTWDYSTSMLKRGWTLACSCGTAICRKTITDFDLLPLQLQQHYLDQHIVLPFIKDYLVKK